MVKTWRVTTPFSEKRSIMLVSLLPSPGDTVAPRTSLEDGPQDFHWMFFGVEQWTEEERDTVERVLLDYLPEQEGVYWKLSKTVINAQQGRSEFVGSREGTGYRDARCIAASAEELAGEVRAVYEQRAEA
jgi:hypothetical protein